MAFESLIGSAKLFLHILLLLLQPGHILLLKLHYPLLQTLLLLFLGLAFPDIGKPFHIFVRFLSQLLHGEHCHEFALLRHLGGKL